MEYTIEVESAEVRINILLKNNITRNGKSPSRIFLVEQNHQRVCHQRSVINDLQRSSAICNGQVGLNIICCSECHCKIHYKSLLLPSYQLYDFIKRKRKYTCANGTPADVSDKIPGSVDIKIN